MYKNYLYQQIASSTEKETKFIAMLYRFVSILRERLGCRNFKKYMKYQYRPALWYRLETIALFKTFIAGFTTGFTIKQYQNFFLLLSFSFLWILFKTLFFYTYNFRGNNKFIEMNFYRNTGLLAVHCGYVYSYAVIVNLNIIIAENYVSCWFCRVPIFWEARDGI